MTAPEDDRAVLARVVRAPEFVQPWLNRFYDPAEIDLVLALADGPLGMPALKERTSLAGEELRTLVERADRRGVVVLEDDSVKAGSFYDRSELWALFAGHGTVPDDVHRAIAEWWLDAYMESARDGLTKLRDGVPEPGGDADYAYLLLGEAEDMVRREEHVYLWPCDCRTLMRACDKPVYNCIRFHNDRGLGWEITTERAIDILREADAAGLMHCDYVGFGGTADPHAICNCCTDCCQPQLASVRLGVSDVWPRRRHVARLLPDGCTLCGTCTDRCPFGALSIEADGHGDKGLVLAEADCRGCGLCSTGCPEQAIAMEMRPAV
jgi:ferredoxin